MASDNNSAKIRWHMNRETRYPFSERPPDPEWFEPIGFPPPWPDRPWIYGVVVASANGVLDLTGPLCNTPEMDGIVVGTTSAAAMLSHRGAQPAVGIIAESVQGPAGLRRAHERLFAERGVRYLACEGGEKILRALRAAG